MLELGYKDVLFQDWLAMFAPARTPPAIVTRVNAAMAEAMKTDQSRRRPDEARHGSPRS